MSPPLVIDTNLLLLFLIGTTDRALIAKHKRLAAFTGEDYDALCALILQASDVWATPNVWTETSNLARQIAEPARGHILRVMRTMVERSTERYVSSAQATQRSEFLRLGLTDAALLAVTSPDAVLLTTDLDLYLAALNNSAQAINFNHLPHRDL